MRRTLRQLGTHRRRTHVRLATHAKQAVLWPPLPVLFFLTNVPRTLIIAFCTGTDVAGQGSVVLANQPVDVDIEFFRIAYVRTEAGAGARSRL